MTIDPDDARDFDDAIHVEEIKGGWQLGVHIADVSAYVTARQRARSRGATPRQQCLFARPCDSDVARAVEQRRLQLESACRSADAFRLSSNLTATARMRQTRFARTVIRSAHRLTYKQAFAILKSSARDELGERLHTAWKLAALLRKKRFEHGSLDLDMPEVKVVDR